MNTKTMEHFEAMNDDMLATVEGGSVDPFKIAGFVYATLKMNYWLGEKIGSAYYHIKNP